MAIPTNLQPATYSFLGEEIYQEFHHIYEQLKKVTFSSGRYFHLDGKQLDITTSKVQATSLREIQKFTANYRTLLTPHHLKGHELRDLFELLEKVNNLQKGRLQDPDFEVKIPSENDPSDSDESIVSDDSDSSLDVVNPHFELDEEKETSVSPPVNRKNTVSSENVIIEGSESQISDNEVEEDEEEDEVKFVTQAPHESAWYLTGHSPKSTAALDTVDEEEPSVEDDNADANDNHALPVAPAAHVAATPPPSQNRWMKLETSRTNELKKQLLEDISGLDLPLEAKADINYRIQTASRQVLEIGIQEPAIFMEENFYKFIISLPSEKLSILEKRPGILSDQTEFDTLTSKKIDLEYLDSLLVRKATTSKESSLEILELEIHKLLSGQAVNKNLSLKRKINFNERVLVFDEITPETIRLNKNDRNINERTSLEPVHFRRSGEILDEGPDLNYHAYPQITPTDMGKFKQKYYFLFDDKLKKNGIGDGVKNSQIPTGFHSSAIGSALEAIESFLVNLKTDLRKEEYKDADILLKIKTKYKVLLFSDCATSYSQNIFLHNLTDHAIDAFNETIDHFKDLLMTRIKKILSR